MQIAEYVGDRRQRIVKYVGSARTVAELGVVMGPGRELLAEHERPDQDALDLGLELEPEVGLVEPVDDESVLDLPVVAPASSVVVLVEPGRVVATASRLLFDVLAGVHGLGVVFVRGVGEITPAPGRWARRIGAGAGCVADCLDVRKGDGRGGEVVSGRAGVGRCRGRGRASLRPSDEPPDEDS